VFSALIRASVSNRVAVHLGQLLIIVAGIGCYLRSTREIFPEFTREKVRVTTIYPGASPEDVEELITVKIEDALDGVDGVEQIESTSQEGVSWVVGRLVTGADMTRTLQDVDRAVAAITDLPDEAEEPLVEEVKTRFPIITVSIYGDVSELALKDIIRPIQRRMEAIPGVADVQPTGLRDLEWRIEVSPEAALRQGVTLDEVARAVGAQNKNVPGGTLERPGDEMLIRTRGETETAAQIEAVVVRARGDGSVVRVGDVATVLPGFQRALDYGRFNGKPSLNLVALKERDGDILEISRQVRELARGLELPAGVEASVHTDLSIFLQERLDIMRTNALQGFALVLLCLTIFMPWRMAVLVAVGIPSSFLITFCAMKLAGISINMMSLFALILVLGMLVDDAIVVVENIQTRLERGEPVAQAAVDGTIEIAVPVASTVLTTIAAFLPMLLTPGEMGQWMWQVPVIVSMCLVGSLLECFAMMPCHVAEFVRPEDARNPARWFARVQTFHDRLVRRCLAWRYWTLAALLGGSLVLATIASVALRFVLFEPFESVTYFLNFELPSGASLEETSERARTLERIVLSLPEEEREACITNIGISAINVDQADRGTHVGQVIFTFTPQSRRTRTGEEIIAELREKVAGAPGFTKLEFKGLQAGPGGSPIEVAVEGDDYEALRVAGEELQGWLRGQDGVHDVFDDAAPGKSELEVVVDAEAAGAVGLTTQAIAQQVRDAFQGREATTVRRLDEDVELVVRYPKEDRALRTTLETLWLATPTGARVPFQAVARAREGRGLARISRGDRRRAVTVFADVDVKAANAIEVTDRLVARFIEPLRQRGVDLRVKGQRREAEQSMQGMLQAFVISLLLIYLILGTQFRSFGQPLLVMIAIPFGLDGIFFGHLLMGKDLSFMSIMGLVAATGIVINDAIVLVDYVNELVRTGVPVVEAAALGSVRRLRAIILTSVTTIAGLATLAFFPQGQAKFLSPMAISIVFGLAFSTFLTLIIIPCLYAVLEDAKGWLRGAPAPAPEAPAAAEA
jgi:multidrug efflux pump subunit AcrB